MPCNYNNYPPNWKTEIRPAILTRAGAGDPANACCEWCGVSGDAEGYRDASGKWYDVRIIWEWLEQTGYEVFDNELKNCWIGKDENSYIKPATKIVLTVAHINHDLHDNRPENLAALCQRCHLNHDRQQHRETRKRNKGLQNLF